MQPYESYVETFNEKYDALKLIVPTVASVSDLYSEEEKLEFIKAFRELLRVKNILGGFSDFKWDDLKILEQEFEDYMSKYLDLKPSVNPNKEKVSILEDVDFELEEAEGAFVDEEHINKHSREKLDEFIEDYNKMFGCKMLDVRC